MDQLSLNFDQILELVKQLPESEKIRLSQELEKDVFSQRKEERKLINAYTKISESSFNKIWDNPEDSDYDNL